MPKSGYDVYGITDPWEDLDESKLKTGKIDPKSLGGYNRWTSGRDRSADVKRSSSKEFLSTFRDKFKDKFRDDVYTNR